MNLNVIFRASLYALCLSLSAGKSAESAPETAFLSYLDDISDTSSWFVAEYAVARRSFRNAWRTTSVTRAADGAVVLHLVPAPAAAQKDFIGAELQRSKRTHFGRYEVVMTAARGEGVISSFFTYTGPYFGDPHDEIDFEFLGRDTTKVWLNRFVDGKNLPGRWIDLGFDAAEGPHLYTLEWLPDRLVWSVDGRELLRVTEGEFDIPQTPQRIYINIWGGAVGQKTWSGEAPADTTAEAHYYCLSYRQIDSDAPICSETWHRKKTADD